MIKIEVKYDGAMHYNQEIDGMRSIIELEITEIARQLVYGMCKENSGDSSIDAYDRTRAAIIEGCRLGLSDFFYDAYSK